MAHEDKEIYELMFGNEHEFIWEEFEAEDDCYYTGNKNEDNYLLIECDNQIVGSISHSYNQTKIPNFELDIWLRSKEFTGKGIGTKVLNMLVEYLNKEYKIDIFIIRPWSKNVDLLLIIISIHIYIMVKIQKSGAKVIMVMKQ